MADPLPPNPSTVGQALEHVVAQVTAALPQTVAASITLRVGRDLETSVPAEGLAPALDLVQYRTGEGPCLHAMERGIEVLVEDTGDCTGYEELCTAAAERGIGSILALPLLTPEGSIGALNLYGGPVDGFDETDRVLGGVLATQAAVLVTNVQAYWEVHRLNEQLHEAMRSRAQIEQAKGILMATTGCTPEVAFDRLRQQSQHENVPIRELAAEIVRRAVR